MLSYGALFLKTTVYLFCNLPYKVIDCISHKIVGSKRLRYDGKFMSSLLSLVIHLNRIPQNLTHHSFDRRIAD